MHSVRKEILKKVNAAKGDKSTKQPTSMVTKQDFPG